MPHPVGASEAPVVRLSGKFQLKLGVYVANGPGWE